LARLEADHPPSTDDPTRPPARDPARRRRRSSPPPRFPSRRWRAAWRRGRGRLGGSRRVSPSTARASPSAARRKTDRARRTRARKTTGRGGSTPRRVAAEPREGSRARGARREAPPPRRAVPCPDSDGEGNERVRRERDRSGSRVVAGRARGAVETRGDATFRGASSRMRRRRDEAREVDFTRRSRFPAFESRARVGEATHRGQRGGHGARPVVAVEWAPRARERSPEGACLGAKSERRKASVERPRVDPRAFGARSRSAPRALRALRSGLYAGARPADVFSRVRRSSPRLSI